MKRDKNKKPSNLILDLRPIKAEPKKVSLKDIISANGKRVIYALILLIVCGAVVWALTSHKQAAGSKELAQVKSDVGKLMILPKDEEPTLAVVDDRRKLKDTFLIDHAADGDEVLIYSKNGLVIVYRPSSNKIAAVGSVTADPAFPEAKGATLTVLDGANNDTKTKEVIEKVKNAYPSLKVIDGGKSNRQDFPSTIVIDNTNQKDNLVDALVTAITGKRGVLPLGEGKAETDLMIIVGKD